MALKSEILGTLDIHLYSDWSYGEFHFGEILNFKIVTLDGLNYPWLNPFYIMLIKYQQRSSKLEFRIKFKRPWKICNFFIWVKLFWLNIVCFVFCNCMWNFFRFLLNVDLMKYYWNYNPGALVAVSCKDLVTETSRRLVELQESNMCNL